MPRPESPAPSPWLGPWERAGLGLLVAAVVGFGALAVVRSALLTHRLGDVGVFLRAGWAVRAGADLLRVTDDHGFHYHYPPLFAILIAPLADPPPGADRSGTLPYAVSVAVFYVLSVLCLAAAVHVLAAALEQAAAPPWGGRRWWALRLLPVLACLPPIAHTLMRGQVNLLLLLLLCGTAAALLRGRRFQAGLWLAGAVCLKVIPVFLLLFPLWRRDARCLAGCALGLVLGMGVVPLAVLGPMQTAAFYQEWANVLVLPGLGAGGDQARAHELTDVTATASQSFQAMIHNTAYPNPATRPPRPATPVRLAHWGLGGLLTGLTLLLAGRRADGPATVLHFGALVLAMLMTSPVCHLHYFCLALPLTMALVAAAWEGPGTPRLGWGIGLMLAANAVANALPLIPGLQLIRDDGLAGYAALLLWLVGAVVLWRRARRPAAAAPPVPALAA